MLRIKRTLAATVVALVSVAGVAVVANGAEPGATMADRYCC